MPASKQPTQAPKPKKAAAPPKPKAMAHQTTSLKILAKNVGKAPVRILDFSDPGTGKTFVEIMAFAAAMKKGEAMLVLAPRSLLETAWDEDIKKFAPHLVVSVAHAANRQEAFDAKADVYITNHDAVKWLAAKPKGFFARFSRLVIDEITAFKHHTSARSKALGKIKKYFRDRIGMTGTPNSNSITDVWHPVNVIDDGARLGNSFFAFRSTVCEPKQVGRSAQMVKWTDKDGAEEAVFTLLSDITIRHEFSKCIDIPPNFQYTIPYKMPAKQKRAYQEMALTQIAALGKGKAVSAINAASVRTKLLQILSGAVYSGDGKYHLIDDGRYDLTMELVEERKHSIVFFLWTHQRDYMIDQAKKRGIKYAVFDGSTSDKARAEIVRDYQAGFYQAVFAHPASMAHGITLTRATTTIWPSPTDNLEWYKQGNARAVRNGQKQKTETIVILAEDTVEMNVYEALCGKGERMENFLGWFEDV